MDFVRKYFISLIIAAWCLASIRCQNFFTRSDVTDGLSLPYDVQLISGEDLFIRITRPVPGQTKCEFRSPGDVDVDVDQINSNRISKWTATSCGIHIKNVTSVDNGHWRLTSTNANTNLVARGITLVYVKANHLVTSNTPTEIYSPFENISPPDTRYCYVSRPDEIKSEFPQHSHCKIPEIDKDLDANGLWKVVAGIDGKTEEYVFEVYVDVKVEKLDSGVDHDTEQNKIHLRCNLLNSEKVVTFCRFHRLADNIGFNMDEGMGTPGYRYYGDGIFNRECGMTIEQPTDIDRSEWKCYIGYAEGTNLRTIGAVLDAGDSITDPGDEIIADNVYGLHETNLKMLCKAKHALDYCWFTNPSGERIYVSDMADLESSESNNYQYYGTGLRLGDCGLEILYARLNDSGTWTCHAGNTDVSRVESQKEFSVRVSDVHMAASSITKNVLVGGAIIIECTSIPVNLPIDYCRFVLPDGTGFSLNENVTSENALLDTYYFNPNRNRRDGYCSLVVKRATKYHTGLWTCAGRLTGRNEESFDDFTIVVLENKLSVASIIGMVLGAVFIFAGVIAIGIHGYKRRQRLLDESNNELDMD